MIYIEKRVIKTEKHNQIHVYIEIYCEKPFLINILFNNILYNLKNMTLYNKSQFNEFQVHF